MNRTKAVWRYGVAILGVAAALLIKLAVESFVQPVPPFLLFAAVVMAAAWYGGLGPGLVATVLGAVAGYYFFVSPTQQLFKPGLGQNLILISFLLEGGFISWLAERLRFALGAAREQHEALRRSERRLSLILDATSEGVWDWNVQTGEVYYSTRWIESLGYSRDEVPANVSFWESLVHPDDVAHTWAALRDHFEGRTAIYVCENRLRTKSGKWRWNLDRGKVVEWGANGKPVRMVGTDSDISERKQAEEQLRASEALNRAVLSSLAARIAIVDRNGVILAVNDAWDRFARESGASPLASVLPGADYLDVCRRAAREPDESARRALDGIEAALAGREDRFGLEYPCPYPAEQKWFEMVVEPLRRPEGGAVISHTDITPRKVTEEALLRSEARLSAIVRTAADAIITIDSRGIIESVNPAGERMFGYATEEMVGRNVNMLMPSPYREEHDGYLANYLRTGVAHIIGRGREVSGLRKDGSIFPLDLSVSEVNHQGIFTGILRDVTTRKELEREVLEATAIEQRRIGQELHDTVGQELTGLGLMAAALVKRIAEGDSTNASLASRITEELGQVHQQVRDLSRGLVSVEVDPEGLRAALDELAARTTERSGTECAFSWEGPVEVEDTATATHLLRIAQEAVSNALRHGRPGRIRIALQADPSRLTLEVEDDGVGIPEIPAGDGGLGIRLMRYRAGIIGGSLAVGPAAGGGTLVRCLLPRRNRDVTS